MGPLSSVLLVVGWLGGGGGDDVALSSAISVLYHLQCQGF